jgi:hypothetical protein
MQSFGFGLPVVESSRDANGGGRRMSEFKANGHKFGTGVTDVVMVMIVFHSCESVWILWRKSFTEHLCHDEDDEGSEKASASEEIYQGVTRGGKHGQ